MVFKDFYAFEIKDKERRFFVSCLTKTFITSSQSLRMGIN